MANTVISPNMNLPVPVVGVDPGPTYATDVNSCLTLIDAHTHAAGSGVPITPAGLNINSDLTMNNSNLTLVRSVRFTAQVAPLALVTDIGCLYESGVDLYFNDGSGNQVRLTQSGNVAGTSGSIANLTSPASASYVSGNQTFVWQSAANTPANMDNGSVTLRNIVANSKGLTLNPPNAMGADYSLTLPSLPASTNIMTLTASGTIGAALNVDNSSLEISSNTLRVKAGGITQADLAARTTGVTVAAGGVAVSTVCTSYTNGTGSFTDVTNLTVTITTTGRPVMLFLIGTTSDGQILAACSSGSSIFTQIQFVQGSTALANMAIAINAPGTTTPSMSIPPSSVQHIDMPVAGTYTYKMQAQVVTGTGSITVNQTQLVAYEI